MKNSNQSSEMFHLEGDQLYFYPDMHDILIFCDKATTEEIHFSSKEEAMEISDCFNSKKINGLNTKVIFYPYRIRLV